jgi:hypothetical protein
MIYVLRILLKHPNSEATPNSKITGAYSAGLIHDFQTKSKKMAFSPRNLATKAFIMKFVELVSGEKYGTKETIAPSYCFIYNENKEGWVAK